MVKITRRFFITLIRINTSKINNSWLRKRTLKYTSPIQFLNHSKSPLSSTKPRILENSIFHLLFLPKTHWKNCFKNIKINHFSTRRSSQTTIISPIIINSSIIHESLKVVKIKSKFLFLLWFKSPRVKKWIFCLTISMEEKSQNKIFLSGQQRILRRLILFNRIHIRRKSLKHHM